MANVKIIFCGELESEQAEKQIQLYVNDIGLLFIQLEDVESDNPIQYTVLDKSTAIRLSRELKKQISLMAE